MRRAFRFVVPVLIAAALAPVRAQVRPPNEPPSIPARPEQLQYPPFRFEVPKAERYRHALARGTTVYVAEDHSLPLVSVTLFVRAGAFLEPADEVGLAALTGTLMRKGGAGSRTALEFDERADFLAAVVSSSIDDTSASFSVNTLARNVGPSLDLLFDMLTAPRFEEGRLEIEKTSLLEEMKQRNDDAADIAAREWDWLMDGAQHFSTRPMTKKDLDRITRADLVDFQRRTVRPENVVVVAVSGDVDTRAILAELDRRFAAWKPAGPGAPVPWPPEGPQFTPKPGLYYVDKDIPQGKVTIGHLSTTWKNPDHLALSVMNYVLGGGGFTSRITKKVRSDEGLAYSAGSTYGIGTYWPGDFDVFFQSKSATVALAAKLSIDELKRIREEPVTQAELDVAKNAIVETFPRRFETPAAIVGLFATDDYIGRPHAYWETYQDTVRRVTVADVERVAKEYLHPDRLVMLVVGKWSDIAEGDVNKRATMAEFGKAIQLPTRDPLTMEPRP